MFIIMSVCLLCLKTLNKYAVWQGLVEGSWFRDSITRVLASSRFYSEGATWFEIVF